MSPLEPQRYTAPFPPAGPPGEPPDEDAVTREFWDRIRLFAMHRLHDAAAAEDVAQETLRRVLEALRGGRVENPMALPAFVYQTARHICLQRYRSAGREARALGRLHGDAPAADAPDALAGLIAEERRAVVQAALTRLDPPDRELLRLIYVEGLAPDELATRLGTTPGALRVRKHRALGRLARILDEPDPDQPATGPAKHSGPNGNPIA